MKSEGQLKGTHSTQRDSAFDGDDGAGRQAALVCIYITQETKE